MTLTWCHAIIAARYHHHDNNKAKKPNSLFIVKIFFSYNYHIFSKCLLYTPSCCSYYNTLHIPLSFYTLSNEITLSHKNTCKHLFIRTHPLIMPQCDVTKERDLKFLFWIIWCEIARKKSHCDTNNNWLSFSSCFNKKLSKLWDQLPSLSIETGGTKRTVWIKEESRMNHSMPAGVEGVKMAAAFTFLNKLNLLLGFCIGYTVYPLSLINSCLKYAESLLYRTILGS